MGQHFLNLDIGLPTEQLSPPIRGALAGRNAPQEVELAAINRRGRTLDIRVLGSPLRDSGDAPMGVTLLMEQNNSHSR